MAKAIHDAHSALDHGAAALKKFPHEAVDAVQDLATGVRDEALELVESAHDHANDFGRTVGKAIRAKPYQTVCIAIGIGCVIGIMIARR